MVSEGYIEKKKKLERFPERWAVMAYDSEKRFVFCDHGIFANDYILKELTGNNESINQIVAVEKKDKKQLLSSYRIWISTKRMSVSGIDYNYFATLNYELVLVKDIYMINNGKREVDRNKNKIHDLLNGE